jgi:hypothetical protein
MVIYVRWRGIRRREVGIVPVAPQHSLAEGGLQLAFVGLEAQLLEPEPELSGGGELAVTNTISALVQ